MIAKYKIIITIFLLAIYCFAFQGTRSLFDPDEGRYSNVALQMIESGDWVTPRTHPDHPHWTKPPLAYWSIASSILLFGKNEFAVRFTNSLSFLITIIISFFFGKVFIPKRPWVVSLIFATCLFPATMCNGATTDYLLTVWEALAVCFFVNAFWGNDDKKRIKLTMLMWGAFGFAFLTKGPPALLPLLSIVVFLRLNKGRSNFKLLWMRGLPIMFAIAGSWFTVVIFKNFELIRYFLWDEVVLRVFTGHHQRHSSWYAAFYIFLPVLVFGTLPWSYFTGKGLIRALKVSWRKKVPVWNEENEKHLFLISWVIIPLAVFVISRSKLPLYMLPLFVPLAILTAREIQTREFSFYKFRYFVALWCFVIVLIRPVMASVDFKQDSERLALDIRQYYPQQVDEITFVNTVPALGLHFYTGSQIEEVSLDILEIEKQFKENKTRLWCVLVDERQEFLRLLAARNIKMQEFGQLRGRKNYVLFKKIADRIN